MRFIARFAMRGPYHAAAIAAVMLLGSIAFLLLAVISGAIIALATLRHGTREGLKVIGMAGALVVLAQLIIAGQPAPALALCIIVWLPALMMAANLRRSHQQAQPLMMVAVLVSGYAVAIRLAVGDVAGFWAARLAPLFEQLAKSGAAKFSAAEQLAVAAQFHLMTLVAMFSMLAGMILWARWWQAILFNPGGFASEFRELRLPRVALVVAGGVAIALIAQRLAGVPLVAAGDVFAVVVVLFALQGLAVIHHRAHTVQLSRGWLTGLYVLLGLMPQIVGIVLATTGVADSLSDFRRLGRTAQDKRE